jgi:excisionase family DNA binding protein
MTTVKQSPPRAGFATVAEVAAFLKLSQSMVRSMVRTGQVPSRRFGTTVRIPWEWLHQEAASSAVGQGGDHAA